MKEKIKIDKKLMTYLHMQSPKDNRGTVLGMVLLCMDFFGVFPLLGEPFSSNYFIAAIAPVAIIHIWGIIYVIDPHKFEHSYYLFMGVYGIVNTYVYFLVIQKFIYLHIGITSSVPFIVGIILFIALLLFTNWLSWKALYSEKYARLQKKIIFIFCTIVIIGIGVPFGNYVALRMYSDSIQTIVFVLVIGVITVFVAHFSTYIHRYFLIKNNMEMVRQVDPGFGLSKEKRSEVFKQLLEERKNVKNPSRKNRKKRNRNRKSDPL